MRIVEGRLTATELARRVGDILGRVRFRGDSFLVEWNGKPVARLVPVPGSSTVTLRDAFAAWRGAGRPDPGFAADLERVGASDRPPDTSWGS